MSETNLKKFASLIISLSSQVTDIENKCIKPYVGDELYPRDSYVSYNGYIYQATATNQDSAFDETHWDKLSDDFNELTVADIEAMLGLSQEQLETMANLIADTEVRLDKTYSSSKIYQDIQQCLNDSKTYTNDKFETINDKFEEANVYKGKYVGDLNDIPFIKSGVVYKYDIRSGNCTNTPISTHGILYSTYFDSNNYCLQEFHSLQTNKADIYRRDKGSGVWSKWRRVCTTTVEDVGLTTISMNSTYTNDADCKYQVVNGICYIDFISGAYKLTSDVAGVVLATGLPIPKAGRASVTYIPWGFSDVSSKQVILFVEGDGKMTLHAYASANKGSMFYSFSYPVAES